MPWWEDEMEMQLWGWLRNSPLFSVFLPLMLLNIQYLHIFPVVVRDSTPTSASMTVVAGQGIPQCLRWVIHEHVQTSRAKILLQNILHLVQRFEAVCQTLLYCSGLDLSPQLWHGVNCLGPGEVIEASRMDWTPWTEQARVSCSTKVNICPQNWTLLEKTA